jgi:hypothetical protein
MWALGVGAALSCRCSGGARCLLRTGLSGSQRRAAGDWDEGAPRQSRAGRRRPSSAVAAQSAADSPDDNRRRDVVPDTLVVLGMKRVPSPKSPDKRGSSDGVPGSATARMRLVERGCGWRALESHPGGRPVGVRLLQVLARPAPPLAARGRSSDVHLASTSSETGGVGRDSPPPRIARFAGRSSPRAAAVTRLLHADPRLKIVVRRFDSGPRHSDPGSPPIRTVCLAGGCLENRRPLVWDVESRPRPQPYGSSEPRVPASDASGADEVTGAVQDELRDLEPLLT